MNCQYQNCGLDIHRKMFLKRLANHTLSHIFSQPIILANTAVRQQYTNKCAFLKKIHNALEKDCFWLNGSIKDL